MTRRAGTTAAVSTAATNRLRVRMLEKMPSGTDIYNGVSGRQADSQRCRLRRPQPAAHGVSMAHPRAECEIFHNGRFDAIGLLQSAVR